MRSTVPLGVVIGEATTPPPAPIRDEPAATSQESSQCKALQARLRRLQAWNAHRVPDIRAATHHLLQQRAMKSTLGHCGMRVCIHPTCLDTRRLQHAASQLAHAPLLWATGRIAELAGDWAATAPEGIEHVRSATPPAPTGFVCFDQPLVHIDASHTQLVTPHRWESPRLSVDAISWHPDRHGAPEGWVLALFTRMLPRDRRPTPRSLHHHGVDMIGAIRTHRHHHDADHHDITNVLRAIDAWWRLIHEQKTTRLAHQDIERTPGGKSTRPTKQSPVPVKEGQEIHLTSGVTIHDVRSRAGTAVLKPHERTHSLTCRYKARGHWRNQRCGPGLTSVRRIWIAEQIRGPQHLPYKPSTRVTVAGTT